MTTKIILEDYEIEDMMTLQEGECIESCDINGIEIYIERIDRKTEGAIEIEGKYFLVNYFAPTKIYIKHGNDIYTN